MKVLEQMQSYGHERVAFHQDTKTGLKAVIAIHSTTLGNALGGTRRWAYASESDALHDLQGRGIGPRDGRREERHHHA